MSKERTSEVHDLGRSPFNANGFERASNREELGKILPPFFSTQEGSRPWTERSPNLMSKFRWKSAGPDEHEKRALASGTWVSASGLASNRTGSTAMFGPTADRRPRASESRGTKGNRPHDEDPFSTGEKPT